MEWIWAIFIITIWTILMLAAGTNIGDKMSTQAEHFIYKDKYYNVVLDTAKTDSINNWRNK